MFAFGIRKEFDFIKKNGTIDKSLLKRRIGFWIQKIVYGFSDDELWSLDSVVAKFMLPRLKRFMKTDPAIRTDKEKRAMENMVWVLEKIKNYEHYSLSKEEEERYNKALKDFGKYFNHLWQ